jgi:hypothetical protein
LEVEFEKWWEVVEGYFTKELKKNLVQHRTDGKLLRCNLEACQMNFLNFIWGNLISTEVSGQDEEIESRA